jgi:hypothetical protein
LSLCLVKRVGRDFHRAHAICYFDLLVSHRAELIFLLVSNCIIQAVITKVILV